LAKLISIIDLVDNFEIHKYQFFFGIEISSNMRNSMVTIVSSTLAGIGFLIIENN
jgi:hypothetical protein